MIILSLLCGACNDGGIRFENIQKVYNLNGSNAVTIINSLAANTYYVVGLESKMDGEEWGETYPYDIEDCRLTKSSGINPIKSFERKILKWNTKALADYYERINHYGIKYRFVVTYSKSVNDFTGRNFEKAPKSYSSEFELK